MVSNGAPNGRPSLFRRNCNDHKISHVLFYVAFFPFHSLFLVMNCFDANCANRLPKLKKMH